MPKSFSTSIIFMVVLTILMSGCSSPTTPTRVVPATTVMTTKTYTPIAPPAPEATATATPSATPTWTPVPPTVTPTATPNRRTSTQLTSSPANSAARAQNLTLSAQVKTADGAAATGTVTFVRENNSSIPECDKPVPVNNLGVATCVTRGLTIGAHALVATYSGDAIHDGSSSPLSITITPANTAVSISASSSWNGIPVWRYTATAIVGNTSSGSALIPQGRVTFHFSDRAAVNRDESCNLGSNGSCAVEFTNSFVYYIVSATYQPTVDFSGSASGPVGTGR